MGTRIKTHASRKSRQMRVRPIIEALEDRLLLSATAVNAIASPIVSTTSLNSNRPTSSSYAQFDLSKFASADELRQYLMDQAVAQYSYLFGTHFVPYRFDKSNWPVLGIADTV